MTGPVCTPASVRLALTRNAAYVLPFALSAAAMAAAAYLLGSVWPGAGLGRWTQLAIVLFLAACDLRLGPLRTPGPHRQTNPQWRDRLGMTGAAVAWGLDIGTTVSTIKVTSLYWAALVLLLGLPHPPLQLAVACFAVGYLLAHLAAAAVSYAGRAGDLVALADTAGPAVRVASGIVLLLVGVLIGFDPAG